MGGADINQETNVKRSTSHCKRSAEREVTRRQEKRQHGGGGGSRGETLKGHRALWMLPCSSRVEDFPSSSAMPLMSCSEAASCVLEFHILGRDDFCGSGALLHLPSSQLLIILRERPREGGREAVFALVQAELLLCLQP